MTDEPRKDGLLSDMQNIARQGLRDLLGAGKPSAPTDGEPTVAATADFVELGRQAFRRGEPLAPVYNADVRNALAGLAVGSAEGRKIMEDFTAGWTAANLADDVEGSISSPDELVSPPLYEGKLSQAHTKLAPGRYEATDENDNPVVVEVAGNTSTVARLDQGQ